MIGVVTRTDTAGVYVKVESILPGIELGPLPALVQRYHDIHATVTTIRTTYYQAGDTVMVLEDTPNDFIVVGILTTAVIST